MEEVKDVRKRALSSLEGSHVKTEGLLSEYEHKRDIMCTIHDKMSIFPCLVMNVVKM